MKLFVAPLASVLRLAVYSVDPTAALAASLANERRLIVLDNCEHVIEGAAALAEKLVQAARGVHILTTSREPLQAEREWVYHLPPLLVPLSSDSLAAAEALTHSGIELFAERAKASLDHFELDDAGIVARIIELRECRIDGAVAR